ncbi:MAG: hypothetical protein V4496_00355 [Pseudomonadota bacterium]
MFTSQSRLMMFLPCARMNVRRFSEKALSPSIRWVSIFQTQKEYTQYLKKRTIHANHITDIDSKKLMQKFGSRVIEDFFSTDAIVDLPKLFSTNYENLDEREKRQRTALEKERALAIASMCKVLSVSKCIHERDTEGLKQLLEPTVDNSFLGRAVEWIGLGNQFYEQFSLLKNNVQGEMTFVTEHEFAHAPFLAPFKFKDLHYIINAIREKLEEMPAHSATVLGTIPVALTKAQIDEMNMVIEEAGQQEKLPELYLFNIAIVTAGNHTITFVPKQVKSGIDIRYPIIKYMMHDGLIYESLDEDQKNLPRSQELAPTLESREKLYPNYTKIPLVNLKQQGSRITKVMIGAEAIYIVPEICLEHDLRVAVNAVEKELTEDLSFPIYLLHALIASGAPELKKLSMVSPEIFVNDNSIGGTRIVNNNTGELSAPEITSSDKAKLQIAIFAPKILNPKNFADISCLESPDDLRPV